MNILKAFGNFFAKIWRWIKETAWVQPLLIVGAIFAVIFSIPKITEWVQSFQVEAASRYYANYKHTLQGENLADKDSGKVTYDSEADKLTEAIHEWSNLNGAYKSYEEWDAGMKAKLANNELNVNIDPREVYGEKFFLVYVSNDCSNCDAVQPGFDALASGWNTRFAIDDAAEHGFRLHTIFTDDDSDNDDDFDIEEQQKAFVRYLDKFEDNDFLPAAGERLTKAPYKLNSNASTTNYDYFSTGDHTNFSTPTILLIDFSKESFNLRQSRVGVSEVLFGVSGDDKIAKADNLAKMWNHTGSDVSNMFSEAYNG